MKRAHRSLLSRLIGAVRGVFALRNRADDAAMPAKDTTNSGQVSRPPETPAEHHELDEPGPVMHEVEPLVIGIPELQDEPVLDSGNVDERDPLHPELADTESDAYRPSFDSFGNGLAKRMLIHAVGGEPDDLDDRDIDDGLHLVDGPDEEAPLEDQPNRAAE